MIIGAQFDGDSDKGAMDMQHDVYREAVRSILEVCRQHVAQAATMLGSPNPAPEWFDNREIDQRCLQFAHDILAAAWRFKARPAQRDMWEPTSRRRSEEEPHRDWLSWLRRELESWNQHPVLVRNVVVILLNQNAEAGYEAEGRLARGLLERFGDIPWDSSTKRQAEADA